MAFSRADPAVIGRCEPEAAGAVLTWAGGGAGGGGIAGAAWADPGSPTRLKTPRVMAARVYLILDLSLKTMPASPMSALQRNI
jgi:hypothetical protein